MAFFKFPWSAEKPPTAKKSAKPSAALRGETVEVMRRRARHRLIGAALLVVLAVLGFPVLFDSQPRSIPVDARIEIPDRDNVSPLVVPAAPVTSSVPGANETGESNLRADKSKATASEEAPAETVVSTPAAKTASREAPKEPPKERSAPVPAFVEAKPNPPPRSKDAAAPSVPVPAPAVSAQSAAEKAARQRDAERALALLEGRSGKVPAQAPTIPVAATDGDRYIVQVGAFSDDAKVREARAKLERGGLTTYTQAVQTKDGKRTRVRVGPFNGRQEAETAAAKIKALGLPAAVLSL